MLLNMNTCDVLRAACYSHWKWKENAECSFKKLQMCGCFIYHIYQTKTCKAPMESAH